jgi:hypothetical protein
MNYPARLSMKFPKGRNQRVSKGAKLRFPNHETAIKKASPLAEPAFCSHF